MHLTTASSPLLEILLDSSIDCTLIVDGQARILGLNAMMKSFLGLHRRDLEAKKTFCDLIKLSICEKECQIQKHLDASAPLRKDELPAAKGEKKLRVLLKFVPIPEKLGQQLHSQNPPRGILVVRDSTAEMVVQAKYHKLAEVHSSFQSRIAELEERVKYLQESLRKAAYSRVAR